MSCISCEDPEALSDFLVEVLGATEHKQGVMRWRLDRDGGRNAGEAGVRKEGLKEAEGGAHVEGIGVLLEGCPDAAMGLRDEGRQLQYRAAGALLEAAVRLGGNDGPRRLSGHPLAGAATDNRQGSES